MSESPTRSADDGESSRAARGAAAIVRELRAALLYLTGTPSERLVPVEVARGGAFFSALGFALGALVAGALLAAERVLPAPPVALGLALLAATSRGTLVRAAGRLARALLQSGGRASRLAALDAPGIGASGVVAVGALTLAKGFALASLAGGTLALAVVLAVTLGRWALVVQAYGSLPARPDDFGAVLAREMKFREFGFASVTAMAVTLMLSNAMGVVLLIGVGTVTVALRILVHRVFGGVTATTVQAGGEIGETVALLLCAALVGLARSLGA